MQLKLNEMIATVKEAHNDMIDIESLGDAQLERIAQRYESAKQTVMPDDTPKGEFERVAPEGEPPHARSTSPASP